MNKFTDNDIIIAQATPYGRSALAVIRVSGSGSIKLVESFLKKPLEPGKLAYNIFRSGEFTEKLMAVCFVAPASYSGEDTVELYPHGNMIVCDAIIKAIVGAGARIAERGEFTKRAFLNGKLDLMQCEALADIIDAQTDEQLVYGNKRFDGGFKGLSEAGELIRKALSTVEAVLHYSDELEENEVDAGLMADVYSVLDDIISKLKAEIDGYAGGRIINDGFKLALIGAPNVGKSTLLNVLIGADRAIVTPIAGTTRDTVDGTYVYNGRKFVVTDTAGITDTADEVEKIGVKRAIMASKEVDAVVLMSADGSEAIEPADTDAVIIKVHNKCDGQKDVGNDYSKAVSGEHLCISAKHGINIDALKALLFDKCPKSSGEICNHRQYACVLKCYDACLAAKNEGKKAESLEIVAAELYEAYSAIAALYGEKADESVISDVFDRFCVGK